MWLGTLRTTWGERSNPGPPTAGGRRQYSSQAGQSPTQTLVSLGHCCTLSPDEPWLASAAEGGNTNRNRLSHRAGGWVGEVGQTPPGKTFLSPRPRPATPGSSRPHGSLPFSGGSFYYLWFSIFFSLLWLFLIFSTFLQ